MSNVVAFKSTKKGYSPKKTTSSYNMFEAISDVWGADFDKILFDKDKKESKKLDRAVKKENLRFQSNLIKWFDSKIGSNHFFVMWYNSSNMFNEGDKIYESIF